MKRLSRCLLVAVLATMLMFSVLVESASAAKYSGHMDSWTPHGDAPKSGATVFKFHRGDHGAVRTYRASNEHTVFVDLSDGHRVSRNTFFRDLHEDPTDEVVVTWKWKTDSDGHKYRYASRIGLTE